MKRPNVQCPKCQGIGNVPMSDELLETLDAVKRLKNATAPEVGKVFCGAVKVTAVNNRLEDLRLLGFLARTRNGKSWVYTPTGKRAR